MTKTGSTTKNPKSKQSWVHPGRPSASQLKGNIHVKKKNAVHLVGLERNGLPRGLETSSNDDGRASPVATIASEPSTARKRPEWKERFESAASAEK